MEKHLDCLLFEHETLCEAQQSVECPLKRLEIGNQIETVLQDIGILNADMNHAQAQTLADAAVLLRRVDAMLYGRQDDSGRKSGRMLASALGVVEAHAE